MQLEERNYLKEPIRWSKGLNAEFPYQTLRDDSRLVIRVNDFPEEPFYTLLVNDEEVKDFDDWPENWIRAEDGENKRKCYDEVIDLFARGASPAEVLAFRPSEETQERVRFLLERNSADELTEEEAAELEMFGELEHLMQLVKARAEEYLTIKT